MHLDDLTAKSGDELIDIALATKNEFDFWIIAGMAVAAFFGQSEYRDLSNRIHEAANNRDLKAGYQEAIRLLKELKNKRKEGYDER